MALFEITPLYYPNDFAPNDNSKLRYVGIQKITNLRVGGSFGVIKTIGQVDQLHRQVGSLAFDLQCVLDQ